MGKLGGGSGNWNGEGMGGGGQFPSNLGPGWTRIAPHKEEGFQVSKRGPARGIGKGNGKANSQVVAHNLVSSTCIYVS